MTKEQFYKQADICRRANGSAKIGKSDTLACVEYGGECRLVECIKHHTQSENDRH